MTDAAARWATWGLLGAWTLHDLEEALTIPGWTRRAADELERQGLAVFGRIVRRSREETWTAIGLVGIPFALAAVDGARTGGRSALYQGALLGYGLHALTHIGATIARRGYTPGVATTPLLVAGFSLAAADELLRRRVPFHPAAGAVTIVLGAWVPLSHGIARRAARARRARRIRPGEPRRPGHDEGPHPRGCGPSA